MQDTCIARDTGPGEPFRHTKRSIYDRAQCLSLRESSAKPECAEASRHRRVAPECCLTPYNYVS